MNVRDCQEWRSSIARELGGDRRDADAVFRTEHERGCRRCAAEAAFWRQLEQKGASAHPASERRTAILARVLQSFEQSQTPAGRWRPLAVGIPLALSVAAALLMLAARPATTPVAERAAAPLLETRAGPKPPVRFIAGEEASRAPLDSPPPPPVAPTAVHPVEPAHNPELLLTQARTLRDQGRLRDAVEIYLRLEARSPQNPEVVSALAAVTSPLYLVNAGGADYVDTRGRQWEADRHFSTGNPIVTRQPIPGVPDKALYQTARVASDRQKGASDLQYAFVAGAGNYVVKLHFAEVDPAVTARGQRLFDVLIQNTVVLDDFDIIADAGPRRALVKAFIASSQQGKLTVHLQKVRGSPVLSAIEVLSIVEGARLPPVRTLPPPQTPQETVYRINAGGPDYEDEQGHLWEADAYFNTGHPAAPSRRLDPADVARLRTHHRTHRFDDESEPELRYSFPVPRGQYLVRLHFTEIHPRAARVMGRIFNVLIEGRKVLDQLDVFAEAGFLTPLVKPFTVTVTDGALDIDFQQVTEHPMISGIEVVGQ